MISHVLFVLSSCVHREHLGLQHVATNLSTLWQKWFVFAQGGQSRQEDWRYNKQQATTIQDIFFCLPIELQQGYIAVIIPLILKFRNQSFSAVCQTQ